MAKITAPIKNPKQGWLTKLPVLKKIPCILLFLRSGSCLIIMSFVTYFSAVKTLMPQILVGLCFSAVFLFALNTANADQRDPELDILFSKLKSAETIEDAEQISGRIWQIWATHNASSILSRQMQMGIDLMQSGQLDAANAVFSYVIQQDNEFAEAWNKRATVLFFMGEFERAKYDIAQTLALERNHFGALAGLGMVEVHLGNPKAALEAYRRAASINPHLQDVQQAISRLEEKLKGLPA